MLVDQRSQERPGATERKIVVWRRSLVRCGYTFAAEQIDQGGYDEQDAEGADDGGAGGEVAPEREKQAGDAAEE